MTREASRERNRRIKTSPKPLEQYEPGASREEVFKALRKAIETPKKPSELSDQASSKT